MTLERNDECRFCGKIAHGPGCQFSPDGFHEEAGDAGHCIRCGSTNYGPTCQFPDSRNIRKVHVHGHGKSIKDNKIHCIYCGAILGQGGVSGGSCMFSPTGRHQA